MGRLEQRFKLLAAANRSAFIPFIMAGDPDLSATARLARAAARAGADALEIGVPFSDPMADGPVLQRSAERALAQGVNMRAVLNLTSDLRQRLEIPIILFGYFNPIYAYGPKRFLTDAKRAGVDALLCVDLPPEEAQELHRWSESQDIDLVFLLAPTTNAERVRRIARVTKGFLYFVSVTGVTGASLNVSAELKRMVLGVKKLTRLPVGVGFGISTPEQAAQVASFADAVISGSAVMRLVEQCGAGGDEMAGRLEKFFRAMAGAVGKARVERPGR